MASGVHYIATAREADEKHQVKLPDGTTNSVVTGRKIPDGFKGMDYNAKTVARTFRDENGTVCLHVVKDRTHVHKDNEIVEDPTLLDWQVVIDKTASNPKFVLKNDLTKATEVEQDIYKKEILGEVGKPVEINDTESVATEDLETLKKEILMKKNSLPANKKAALKGKLEENGLPTAFKNVTDIDVLKKVLAVMGE